MANEAQASTATEVQASAFSGSVLAKEFLKSPYVAGIKEGIKAAATKWQVVVDLEQPLRDFKFQGAQTTRFGNNPISATTKTNYEEMLKQLWRFCALKGDYESMLIMIVPTPLNSPSMNVETINEFLRFKRLPKGTTLKSFDGGADVKDVFGDVMTAEGGWNNPHQTDMLSAAISGVHGANNKGGQYEEVCEGCFTSTCRVAAHRLKAQPTRCGNPALHCIFTNAMKQLKKDDADYVEKGNSQLLPCDLRDLRQHLLSSQSLKNLQMWTIIIFATTLFLRHDEYHDITVEQFVPSLFSIKKHRAISLAVKIKGKSDNKSYIFCLYADNEFPELCPVRALLVYTYLLGMKGGFLFPGVEELTKPPADGIYKTTIPYEKFLGDLKVLIPNVIQYRADLKIGTHTFRKTGYCLGVFGEADMGDLKKSARHKTDNEAATYKKDAAASFAKHKEMPHPSNVVRKWKHFIIQSEGNSELIGMMGGCIPIPSLHQAAKYFVNNIMDIGDGHAVAKSSRMLMEVAMISGLKTSEDENWESICQEMPAKVAERATRALHAMLAKQAEESKRSEDHLAVVAAASVAADKQEEEIVQKDADAIDVCDGVDINPRPAKKAKGAEVSKELDNLSERDKLKYLTAVEEKVRCLLQIEKEKPAFSKLTSGAKSFVSRSLTPTMKCLEGCYNGDIAAFCAAYPNYNHTTFNRDKNHTCPPRVNSIIQSNTPIEPVVQ